MSVVLCFYSNQFSVIATDTRFSIGYKLGGHIFKTDDSGVKLFEHPAGWAAGVGCFGFLQYVMQQAAQIDAYQGENFDRLYQECLLKYPTIHHSYLESDLHDSAIILSCVETDKDHRRFLSMRRHVSNIKTSPITKLNELTLYTSYPPEIAKNENVLCAIKAKNSEPIQPGLTNCISRICDAFCDIQSNAKSVSHICDIGILKVDSFGIEKIHIRDDVSCIQGDSKNDFRNAALYETKRIFL